MRVAMTNLEDEEGGPGEGGDDEEDGAHQPVLGGGGRGGSVRLRAVEVHMLGPDHLDDAAFVERHEHGACHRHERTNHFGHVPRLLQVHLLHPVVVFTQLRQFVLLPPMPQRFFFCVCSFIASYSC
jgi:hypothetical protein